MPDASLPDPSQPGAAQPSAPLADASLAGGELVLVPGRRQRLGDQLYGQILDHILSGRLPEGSRLPPEQELSGMFGVSRPVVRQALTRLNVDGLLRTRQGAGTYVLARPSERLGAFASSGDVPALMRCIEARLPLEAAAARLAAERRTPEQLDRIAAAHDAFANAAEAGGMTPDADYAFHGAVAAASGNEYFPALLHGLHGVLLRFMGVALGLTRTGSKERAAVVVQEHAQIVEAIRLGDAEMAGLAMQVHVGQARRRVMDRTQTP